MASGRLGGPLPVLSFGEFANLERRARQRETVPFSVLTVKPGFSVSVPLPCRPLYAFVPDAIVHLDVPAFVSILTTYVIVPFLPFATKRRVIRGSFTRR